MDYALPQNFFRLFCIGKFVYNNRFYKFVEVIILFSEMPACQYGFGMRVFVSFLLLFSRISKVVSVFPTYCFLHNVHSIKCMTHALEQLTL